LADSIYAEGAKDEALQLTGEDLTGTALLCYSRSPRGKSRVAPKSSFRKNSDSPILE
jgi:hypothetical protein